MGTYTTNYNLFMPSIGEQGWGDLVNGNFTTIDTAMKSLDTRVTIAENTITSNTSRINTIEPIVNVLNNTITVDNNETVTFSSNMVATKYYIKTIISPDDSNHIIPYATQEEQTLVLQSSKTETTSPTLTIQGYTVYEDFPYKITSGLYALSPSNSITLKTSRTINVYATSSGGSYLYRSQFYIYINGTLTKSFDLGLDSNPTTGEWTSTVNDGDTIYVTGKSGSYGSGNITITVVPNEPYYIVEE